MKIECSCGAKYEFEVGPEMREHPVSFICPSCGLDASVFVDGLVRRELGQTISPTGERVPIAVRSSAEAQARSVAAEANLSGVLRVRQSQASDDAGTIRDAPRCLRHPGQVVSAKCYVCSKPICPKCMELFGYVCSPLCKAKAEAHGIQIPVYQGQKSIVDARRWRKVVWVSSAAGAILTILLAFWFWYAWFGCLPRVVFSVRFADPAYSGQSALSGNARDQMVFLHGTTLARYDLNLRKETWSRSVLDPQQIQKAVDQQMRATKAAIDKANSEASEHVPKMPSPDELARQAEREAAAELTLYARGQNIWIASSDNLVRYDWQNGNTLEQLPLQGVLGPPIHRTNELMLVQLEAGKPVLTRIDLVSGKTRTEQLSDAGPGLAGVGSRSNVAPQTTNPAGNARSTRQEMGGLPMVAGGKDAGQPMDPAKVAAQAQHLSLPEKVALPAVLAGNMNQQRALNELNEQGHPGAAVGAGLEPGSSSSLVPTKDGFMQVTVKLLEARIVSRSAMKGSGKSALEGEVTAGRSMELANDMLNEAQRSNGGDIVQEDHSRYEVTLRQAGSETSWSGEVVGRPKLYPLDTVNVLAADKLIIVFDKANKKVWQSALNYNISAEPAAPDEGSATYGQGPCVEHKGTLYVFDDGVLSAFELSTGAARWRLPSVGIAGMFFDDQDMLYVNSTTASHESLKYSRQIDVSSKVLSVILKLDSRTGKILWSTQSKGLVNYVSGKSVLTAQSYMPPEQEGPDTGFEKPPWMRIKRLNPRNGQEVWDYYQDRAPLDIGFDKNTIRLVFKKEVQVLRYPGW